MVNVKTIVCSDSVNLLTGFLRLMDSKIVNRETRSHIWPLLRTVGFSVFTARTAWRYSEEQIDVFNFQSFNRYNSDILGVTSFSFCVNLGSYLTYLPRTWLPKS